MPRRIVFLLFLVPGGPVLAQTSDSLTRTEVLVRMGAGAVTANGVGVLRPALEVAAGVLLHRRYAIVGQYVQHSALLAPGRAELGVFTRRFVLASVEWSRQPLDLRNLGDLGGALRGTVGGVFREGLGAGAVLGAGLAGRFALNRRLSVLLDLQALVSVLPDDPVDRCPAEGSLTPDCNPFASSGSLRPEGKGTLLLELRL